MLVKFSPFVLLMLLWLLSFEQASAQNDPFRDYLNKKNLHDQPQEKTQIKPQEDPNAGDVPEEESRALSEDGVDTSAVQPLLIPEDLSARSSNSAYDKLIQSELSAGLPILTCRQLSEMLQKRQSRNQLAILDARSKDEFEISHLETAQRVGFKDFSNELVWSINRNAIIVVYAATGAESEELGLRLKQMGFKKVYNLYGSIMEWVNQGYSVVDKDNQPTLKVHVGSKKRAKYLKKGKAVYK